MFLAIDPGETTGWATFNLDGYLIDFGQVKGFDGFDEWLEKLSPKPSLIICEKWVTNPKVPQGGSTQETAQVIGAIRSYSRKNGIDIEWQMARILLVGYKWAGLKPLPKSKHYLSHQYDAIAHGTYYLVNQKIKPTALEIKLTGQKPDLIKPVDL